MPASASDREVASRLAAYDVVALPVTDEVGRLVGAVTIDDVLDRMLPANWRATLTDELMARQRRSRAASRHARRARSTTRTRSRASPSGWPGSSAPAATSRCRRSSWSSGSCSTASRSSQHWDPYPFILLNLAFSTQAAYAAPLILLAQNRQADRDRAEIERDRETNSRSLADTEYLAREIAAIRIALEQKADKDDLLEPIDRLTQALETFEERPSLTHADSLSQAESAE